ncbi:MAG: hypothetical protein ACD_66C00210G0001, partial [uncultured bacterium]
DDMPVFRPGMPAPLPPGLDLSDLEKISNSEPPESLPV